MVVAVTGCGAHSGDVVKQAENNNNSSITQFNISPAYASLIVGNTCHFSATGNTAGSSTVVVVSPTWEVNGDIGKISSSGIFTATKTGTGQVIGRYAGLMKTSSVQVTDSATPVVIVDTTPPQAPKNITGQGYNTSAYLQWDAVMAPDLSKYIIYRSLSKGDGYSEVSQTSATGYYDINLEMGKSYFYKIKSVDTSMNISEYSDAIEIKTVNYNAPLPPQGLTASYVDQSISLNWGKNSEGDMDGYNVYRKDESNDENSYSKLNSSTIKDAPYNDSNVKNAHLYKYVVTAVNTSDKESFYSTPFEIVALSAGATNNPPQISLSVSGNGISPNNDGIQDNIVIDYNITDDYSNSCKYIDISINSGASRRTILHKDRENLPLSGSFIWDGKDDNGAIFQDGNAVLSIGLYDDTNLYSSKSVTMIVDTTIPAINGVSQNLNTISPNDDGKYDSLDILFVPDEDGLATLTLNNEALETLANINVEAEAYQERKVTLYKDKLVSFKRNKSTGIYEQDKGVALSKYLTNGRYSFNLYMTDPGGNKSVTQTGSLEVDLSPPIVRTLSVTPNPFSPNGDGINDTTTFSWTLSEPSAVHLVILKDDGTVFREYEANLPAAYYATSPITIDENMSGEWVWDGRGSGNELLEGSYKYYIVAEDNVGNIATSETKTLTIAFDGPSCSYMYAKPDPFSPVNTTNNYTDIFYKLGSDNCTVSLWVGSDIKIKSLLNDEPQNAGEHSVRWYGDYDAGYSGSKATKDQTKVGDSSYVISIKVSKTGYPDSAEGSNTVLVDNMPPYIVVQTVQVDATTKKANLIYNIPENSSVEVTVLDNDNNLVATVLPSTGQSAGDHSYDWYGTQSSVQYHFNIVAIDLAQNRAEAQSGEFSF